MPTRKNMSREQRASHLEKRRAAYRATPPDKKAKLAATLRKNYDRRKAAGICVSCTDVATTGLVCMYHWIVNCCRAYGLTVDNGGVDAMRRKYEQQGGVCALTGDRLVPGISASIDHIVPQSRGGTNDPSNLQWATKQANYAKSNMTTAEFVDMCRKVVNNCGNVVAIKRVG